MGLVGADIGLLRNLIAQLSGPMQSDLNGVLAEMNDQVQASSAYWVAEDGDTFRTAFAAFAHSTKTQLDGRLATAAKVTGQNLQAIGTATGSATGQAATSGPEQQGSGPESLGYYWTKNFEPVWDHLNPAPWTHLLSGESKTFTTGLARFLLFHYDGGRGLRIDIDPDDVPVWATSAADYVAGVSIVTSMVSQGILTYSQDETAHPNWSRDQLLADAAGQGVFIGGLSSAASLYTGLKTAPIVNKLVTKLVSKTTEQTAEATEQAEAAEQAEAVAQTEGVAQTEAVTQTEAVAQTEAGAAAETTAATAEEQAVVEAAQAAAEAEAAAAQAVADAATAAAQTLAETAAAAAERAAQAVAQAAAQAATEATAAAQTAEEAIQAAEQIAAEAAQVAQEFAATAAQVATQAAAEAAEAQAAAAAARGAAQAGTQGAAETTAEAGTEGAAETTAEAGTEVAAEAGTEVAVEAGAETAGEIGAEIGTDALIGAALGSEVPILGNAVGLLIGLAVGATLSFAAGKLGSAIGHTIWDAGEDVADGADHLFHDLF
jgi:hypothetical protein